MMRTMTCGVILLLLGAVTGAQTPQSPQSPTTRPAVDPVADQILKQSMQFLAQSRAFAVHAEVWKDLVLPSGHKIQVTRSIDLAVRRPDRFHLEAHAHHKGRSIWDDGKTLTVLEWQKNLYGQASAPPTIDQALDELADRFGITVQLEDLAVADPYASAVKHVNAGGYFGEDPVLGVPCRHVGFSTDRIDWQLWVAKGPQPLPKKLVITYKTEDQCPQYIAIFSKWNLQRASDLAFEFIPPPGSSKIPLVAQNGQDRP